MLAIAAVITAGFTSIKAKGRMGIRETTANDNPVKRAALVGGHDSSEVSPTSSPMVWDSLDSISEATLSAIASDSCLLNPLV